MLHQALALVVNTWEMGVEKTNKTVEHKTRKKTGEICSQDPIGQHVDQSKVWLADQAWLAGILKGH